MIEKITRQDLISIVSHAAKPIVRNFGLPLTYVGKDGRITAAAGVTALDQEIQDTLLDRLPGDFIGEEAGGRDTGARLTWLVDPLDGTGARIRSHATSLCIVTRMQKEDGVGFPKLTIMHNPATNQTWSAEAGQGAYYQYHQNTEIRLSLDRQAPIPSNILASITSWPGHDYNFDEVKAVILADSRFENQDVGALGTAHATVATGTSHLSACRASAAYETAAATLLMQEAGGIAWDLDGNSLIESGFPLMDVRGKNTFAIPNGAIIAGSTAVAKQFLQVVREVNAR